MKKQQSGFTLIELMIVVAIIGILAAVALPAYQDYVARSQVSEAMGLGSGLKIQVADIYSDQGDFDEADSGSQGIPAATTVSGKYVLQGAVTDGLIEIQMGNDASAVFVSGTSDVLALSPYTTAGALKWSCNNGAGDTTIEDKYLPAACRS